MTSDNNVIICIKMFINVRIYNVLINKNLAMRNVMTWDETELCSLEHNDK